MNCNSLPLNLRPKVQIESEESKSEDLTPKEKDRKTKKRRSLQMERLKMDSASPIFTTYHRNHTTITPNSFTKASKRGTWK